jgi:hypothetical protein
MTAYTLNFWSKNCGATQIRRVYVNAADRSSLGYFEERIGLSGRGESYYDQHRLAKGDATAETGRTYACTVPAEAAAAIYAAPSIAAHIAAAKSDDDFSKFDALVHHARGVDIMPYHPAKSAAGRAERKAIKERQSFMIEL